MTTPENPVTPEADRIGYVVITFNPPGGEPVVNSATVLPDLEAATVFRDWEIAESLSGGRRERHVIGEVMQLRERPGPAEGSA